MSNIQEAIGEEADLRGIHLTEGHHHLGGTYLVGRRQVGDRGATATCVNDVRLIAKGRLG